MKKIFSLLLICLFLFSCISTFAIEDMHVISQKPITVTYNGESIQFPDALPLIQNGRTLVPVRAIMERSGLVVGFDEATRGVSGTKDGFSVNMQIDNANASVTKDGVTTNITLDEPARLIDGRTYVPVRFIAESLDLKVNWNPTYREVVIIDTEEWRQFIEEKSKFLDKALTDPVSARKPYTGKISGDYQFGYYINSDLFFSLDTYINGTEVFDGTNTGTHILLETKPVSLKNVTSDPVFLDDMLLQRLAKGSKIDLDIVTDNQGTTYVKSPGLLTYWIGPIAEELGDAHIAIPSDAPYAGIEADILASASGTDSIWDLFCEWVNSDDLLYSQSVSKIGHMLILYADLFSDKRLTVTENKDGSEHWHFQIQDDFSDLILELSKISGEVNGSPMTSEEIADVKEILDLMDFNIIMEMTSENDMVSKSELIFSLDTGNFEIADPTALGLNEDATTMRITFSLNIDFSNREFNSRTDKKVSIPKETVPLEELMAN